MHFRIINFEALSLAGLIAFSTATPALASQAFHHPGILSNEKELAYVKQKIQANQQPWKQAFDGLKASSYASLSYQPRPFQIVSCGSYNANSNGCEEMVEDGVAAYSQSLMWWITGDARYAANAKKIINAWSGKYQKNTGTNSRLVISWSVPWYVNAAEILRYTGADWAPADIQSFSRMLTEKMLDSTLDESMPGNNWIQSAIEAHFAIAIFTDDRALFDQAAARWRFRVKTYIYQASDGPVPLGPPGKSAQQIASLWRHETSGTEFVDGLGQETCRDLGHLFLGFKSMMYAGKYAWQQGLDLFAPEQKRISDFLELHGGWMTGREDVPSRICGGALMINPDTRLGANGGGGQALEIAYNHIGKRLGNDLPSTSEMLRQHRPTPARLWVSKWETLTDGDLPELALPILSVAGPRRTRNGTGAMEAPGLGLFRLEGESGLPGAWFRLDGSIRAE